MLRIIGSNEDNNKTGYFGDTRFLNSQTKFNSAFGLRPALHAPNPTQDPSTIQADLQRFLSYCKTTSVATMWTMRSASRISASNLYLSSSSVVLSKDKLKTHPTTSSTSNKTQERVDFSNLS